MNTRDSDAYPPINPRDHLCNFAIRSLRQFDEDPTDTYCAKHCVTELNNNAERLYDFRKRVDAEFRENFPSARAFRRHLAEQSEAFHIVWDLADNHKHVRIDRQERLVSSTTDTHVEKNVVLTTTKNNKTVRVLDACRAACDLLIRYTDQNIPK
jgi:hypothetical protein